MLKEIKVLSLEILKRCGLFEMVADSRWRHRRLLILCYHGISLRDEHQWRPALYMKAELLAQRFRQLNDHGYAVLPLGDALERLYYDCLPPRSVAITFDDGGYDFYEQAFPLVKQYQYPVTVYQTTYYSAHRRPIFHLICSYMLWQRRHQVVKVDASLDLGPSLDLRTETSREQVVEQVVSLAERQNLSAGERDALAARLGSALGIDYEELLSRRILQLMTPEEIRELSQKGVGFQLHTHRHRTPRDRTLFQREIRDNRNRLEELTRLPAIHFCYPSGQYEPGFLPWLAEEKVISATTCDPGLASPRTNPLLLERFVDTSSQSAIEFESWLAGVGACLPRKPRRRRKMSHLAGN